MISRYSSKFLYEDSATKGSKFVSVSSGGDNVDLEMSSTDGSAWNVLYLISPVGVLYSTVRVAGVTVRFANSCEEWPCPRYSDNRISGRSG